MGDRLGTPGGPGFDFRAAEAAGRAPQDFKKRRKFYFCQTSKACPGSRKTATVLKSFLVNSIMLLLYREFYWRVISFDGGPVEAAKTASKRVFSIFLFFGRNKSTTLGRKEFDLDFETFLRGTRGSCLHFLKV